MNSDRRHPGKKARLRAAMITETYRIPRSTVKRKSPLNISEDAIRKMMCGFECYSAPQLAPGVVVREGLRNTVDSTPYMNDLPDQAQVQKDLWDAELVRLHAAVANHDERVSFTGSHHFKHDNKDGCESLASVANEAWIALNIVYVDWQGILGRHVPDLQVEELFENARAVLERYVGDEADDGEDDDADDADDAAEDSGSIDPKFTAEDYNEFINYITARLAQLCCRAASGKVWHEEVLSVLVRLSTKLKVVSFSLKESVSTSLDANPKSKQTNPMSSAMTRGARNAVPGRATRDQATSALEGSLRTPEDIVQATNSSNREGDSGPKTRRKALIRKFWFEDGRTLHSMLTLVRYLLLTLRGTSQLTTTSRTAYELSAVLYNTMFGDFHTLIYQDVDGDYLGASRPEIINVAHAAFELLNEVMTKLHDTEDSKASPAAASASIAPPPPRPSTAKPDNAVGTVIAWYYSTLPDESKDKSAASRKAPARNTIGEPVKTSLRSMNDVINASVPLRFASPRLIQQMTDIIGACAFAHDDEEVVLYEAVPYTASFCLTTSEYRITWKKRPDLSVTQLSRAMMTRDGLLSQNRGEAILLWKQSSLPLHEAERTAPPPSANSGEASDFQKAVQKHRAEVDAATKKMNDWLFEEKGVRVRCPVYVWTTLVIAGTLVAGGIVAGLTIEHRLEPVDPLNITMFCWVLSGFLVIVAKALRVTDWPWRDFLRREVLCRSVTELCAASGVDDQLVLSKLLHDEDTTRLQTRGAFNCVFKRKTETADGFSIDRPMSLRTMVLNGLIMIQVRASYHGELLVCLDLRKGTEYHVVPHENDGEGGRKYIVSDSTVFSEDLALGKEAPRRIPLKESGEVNWSQIVGVYGNAEDLFG